MFKESAPSHVRMRNYNGAKIIGAHTLTKYDINRLKHCITLNFQFLNGTSHCSMKKDLFRIPHERNMEASDIQNFKYELNTMMTRHLI